VSKIQISQRHNLSPEEARERLVEFDQTLQKYGARLDWRGQRATIKGIGVSGVVTIASDEVRVELKLGLIAKAAGVDPKRLQGSIERRLSAAFSDNDR
jgi:putative polyhydroxyalkanoate system protein